MSAKKAKRPTPAPAAAVPSSDSAATPVAEPAWIDSPDPKKRHRARILLVALWLYVGALGLLALDQWFHWGIFGPKTPLVP